MENELGDGLYDWRKWEYRADGEMVTETHDIEWAPVARFIERLPALSEVDYCCSPQLAPCLLTAIESKAHCKLSLGTFALRSFMGRPLPTNISLNPYEVRLITSPSLHSITLNSFKCLDPYTLEAVRCRISGCAPNLRKMGINQGRSPAGLDILGAMNRPEPEWHGSELGARRSTQVPGTGIEALELSSRGGLSFRDLKAWTEVIDFDTLTDLRLHGFAVTSLVACLAEDVSLNSLKTLVQPLPRNTNATDPEQKAATMNTLATKLFRKMPVLHTLRISGALSRNILDRIVTNHGHNLRKLTLMPYCEDWGLKALGGSSIQDLHFLNLQELSIPIHRTLGSELERHTYRTIAEKFPRLETVRLLLNCSHHGRDYIPRPGREEQAFDEKYSFTDSRDDQPAPISYVLLNHAVDADLISSVFHYINRHRPSGSFSFRRLELRVWNFDGLQYPDELDDLCEDVLGMPYACYWKTPGERQRGVVTERIDAWHTMERGCFDLEDDNLREAFRSLWPFKDGQNWTKCWRSVPLRDFDDSL
ncbi:uncharacterized protein RHO25_010658 [Cercospora beticola]|nr:hypothetical protein RHO25_010658 [Cercospora beticola]